MQINYAYMLGLHNTWIFLDNFRKNTSCWTHLLAYYCIIGYPYFTETPPTVTCCFADQLYKYQRCAYYLYLDFNFNIQKIITSVEMRYILVKYCIERTPFLLISSVFFSIKWVMRFAVKSTASLLLKFHCISLQKFNPITSSIHDGSAILILWNINVIGNLKAYSQKPKRPEIFFNFIK